MKTAPSGEIEYVPTDFITVIDYLQKPIMFLGKEEVKLFSNLRISGTFNSFTDLLISL